MSTKNRNDIQNGNIIVVAGRYKAVYGTDNDCQFGSCGAEQVSYFFFRYLYIISTQEDSQVLYMSFDRFLLAVESRDLFQSDKSII